MEEIFHSLTATRDQVVEYLEFEKMATSEIALSLRDSESDFDSFCVNGLLPDIFKNASFKGLVQSLNVSLNKRCKCEWIRLKKRIVGFGIVDLRPFTISVHGDLQREEDEVTNELAGHAEQEN